MKRGYEIDGRRPGSTGPIVRRQMQREQQTHWQRPHLRQHHLRAIREFQDWDTAMRRQHGVLYHRVIGLTLH